MTPELSNQITVGLLILMLATVLFAVLVFAVLIGFYLKRSRAEQRKNQRRRAMAANEEGWKSWMPMMEGPSRWLAVRSGNIQAVQNALGLHNPTPCLWGEPELAEHSLFISPPVRGWILIVGTGVPDPAENVDECYRWVRRLSADLGEVQFFSVNRVVNHHAWVRADMGEIGRAYAWVGETVWNQGAITAAEEELELSCFGYGEGANEGALLGAEGLMLNAERVGLLAARWSVDPWGVDAQWLSSSSGIAGDLPGVSKL